MKKISVKSPANIAFIKYWGQRDNKLILPYNDSFSMNLSGCTTRIEIETTDDPSLRKLYIREYKSTDFRESEGKTLDMIIKFADTAKRFLGKRRSPGFIIRSENTFPKKAGIASSASFFSALALGFSRMYESEPEEKELSILARLSGSGSACRSIPDGFVWWQKGTGSSSSYAYSLAPPAYWDLRDVVLILSREEKKVGSQEGHQSAITSNLYKERLYGLKKRMRLIRRAFENKEFSLFGRLVEADTVSMHSVMMTQNHGLFYWSGKTLDVIREILALRQKGTEGYFSIDAGENVHVICRGKDEGRIAGYFKTHPAVIDIIRNSPSVGARIIHT